MTEQLPVINTSHNVTATKGKSSSLLGRGLAAIQRKETGVVLSDLDSRYRQARDIYNRITDYGEENRFKVELLPTAQELLEEPLLQQLQPFYNQIRKLAEVFTVFQELANQGYARAYFPLCLMYKGGQGIAQNIEKSEYYGKLAFTWCSENQTLNEPEIWTDLGWLHELEMEQKSNEENTELLPTTDFETADFYYHDAVEQDYAPAMYRLGLLYEDYLISTALQYEEGFATDVSLEEAKSLQRKAAEKGYALSQYKLGLMYENHKFDVWNEEEQAVLWYRKAAEQDYAPAQHILGFMYDEHLIDGSDKQAVFWYRKAAEQGYGKSQLVLGFMYEHGKGVDKNEEQAVFWYIQAANQNDKSAKSFLKKRGINWQES